MLIRILLLWLLSMSSASATTITGKETNICNVEYQNLKYEDFQFKFENILLLLNKMEYEYEDSSLFAEFFFNVILTPIDYLDYLNKYEIFKEDITDNEFNLTLIQTLEYVDLKKLHSSKILDILYIAQSIHILKNDLENQNINVESEIGQETIRLEINYLFSSFEINKIK